MQPSAAERQENVILIMKRLASVVNNNNSKEPRTDVEVDLLLGMACPDMP